MAGKGHNSIWLILSLTLLSVGGLLFVLLV